MSIKDILERRKDRKARRERNAKFQSKIAGKKRLPSPKKCEKIKWDAFSLFIRERDRYEGCITCGVKADTLASGDWQAGHTISRKKLNTKYNEECVNGQCRFCNYKDKMVSGYHDYCVAQHIKRYGYLNYLWLVQSSQLDGPKYSPQEKLDQAAEYMRRYQILKDERLGSE